MAATEVINTNPENNSESEQYFEGVEKLLEIWFTNNENSGRQGDLRKISR